jgi:hypothetical protein
LNPLCIELFAGCCGWAEGFVANGWEVLAFDIVHEPYHGTPPDGCQLVLQDVLTLHGRQFKDAACIVASPPCQAYSYRAMPWSRAKALPPPDNTLFEDCFLIQREACEAAGRHIPMIVENVRGAERWVGPAKWHYGSFYLWGDVPAIMPITKHATNSVKLSGRSLNAGAGKWRPANGLGLELSDGGDGIKNARNWSSNGAGKLSATTSSKSLARKAASAAIAKIPFELSSHIARVFHPG